MAVKSEISETQEATKAHVIETAKQLLEALNEFEHFWNMDTNLFECKNAISSEYQQVWNGWPVREFLEHFLTENSEI